MHVIAEQEVLLPDAVGLAMEESPAGVGSYVKISYPREFLDLSEVGPQIDELAVCVAPAHHNFGNVLRIVEFVEIYKLLGATRFYLYEKSVSSDASKALQYYKTTEHIAEILQWNLSDAVDVHYEGIRAALNDCVYRATFVDNFKYVAVVDYDEILMPLSGFSTLLDLIRSYDNSDVHSFNFQNVFFFFHQNGNFSNVPQHAGECCE